MLHSLVAAQVVPQFQSADAFGKFSAAISKVIAVQPDMAAVDIVAMYSSLMAFALQVLNGSLVLVPHCAHSLAPGTEPGAS